MIPGEILQNGVVFAGLHPDSGQPLYASSRDTIAFNYSVEIFSFFEAWAYARDGWRIPTMDELTVVYNARESVGGFHTGVYLCGAPHYLSSCWVLNFADGARFMENKHRRFRIRLVRGVD